MNFIFKMNDSIEDDYVCQRNASLSRQTRFRNPQQASTVLDILDRRPRKLWQPKMERKADDDRANQAKARRKTKLIWRAKSRASSALVSSANDDEQSSRDGEDRQSLGLDNGALFDELSPMSLLSGMSKTGIDPTIAFSWDAGEEKFDDKTSGFTMMTSGRTGPSGDTARGSISIASGILSKPEDEVVSQRDELKSDPSGTSASR